MSSNGDAGLATLSTAVLIEQTRREIERFCGSEATGGNVHALELFRRAIVLGDEGAWAGLYTLYEHSVRSWILQVQPRANCFSDDDLRSLISDTFLKFARYVSASKFPLFAHSVPALLSYLKQCARSVTFDTLAHRKWQKRRAEVESLEAIAPADLIDPCDPADLIAEWDVGNHLWDVLLRSMRSPAERVVLYSIAAEVSPGGLFKRYPSLFASSDDVYRIKRNIIDRCKRIPLLQAHYRKRG